ncbi:nucleotidyltransferase family protein [Geodermatophilus sp. SYSU D01036]
MSSARRFLVATLPDEAPLPPLDAEGWEQLPGLAREHGLSPRVNGLLDRTDAPDQVRQEFRRQAVGAVVGSMQAHADLVDMAGVLESCGVPWVAVKGPVLADHWYATPGQRSFLDLDVVVDPAGFGEALTALEDAGAELVDRNFTHALAQQRAELVLLLPHGTTLDLHWHVLNTPELRTQLPISIGGMLGRRRTVRVEGTAVPTFDTTDTLLHLCMHTILSGGQKLSWYRDLQQVVATGVAWRELLERTRAARAGVVAAVALQRAARLARAVVPPGLLRGLAPEGAAWRTLVRAVDAVRPLGAPTDRRLSGRLLVESSRADTPSSRRALLRSVADDLVRPVLHDPDHPWRRVHRGPPPRRVNPLRAEPEALGDRDRYLRFVASQAGG